MHRIGVFATRPADLHPLREHISALFGSLPDDAVWDFHYFSSWNRFRQALTRRELQLGLLVNLRPGEQFPELAHLCREHAIAVLGDQPLPADVTPVATLAPTGLDPAALQAMLRNALRRAELDDELRYLAEHDACTGLLRDEAFAKQLNQSLTDVLQRTQRTPASPALGRNALLCLRLDGYDELEATLGTASAERVLRMAAERLRGVLQRGELLARGNGPEFLAWLRAGHRIEAAAARLQQAFEAPFHLNESSAFVRASAGMARADGCEHAGLEEGPGDALIRQARAAADVVLQRTGVRSLLYDPGIEKASRRQQVRAALATAIERDEFDVFYQPIVNLAHGNVAGAEALLRWHGQSVGQVSPAHFIPLAEESGAIQSIGQWVLRRACHDAVIWLDRFWTQVRIGVNIAPDQFRSGRVHEDLHQLLQDLPLHARQVELEISERNFLLLAREHYDLFENLRDQGFRIVLDEFGSSYASLSYLKQYPVDVLKIDRHLIAGLDRAGAGPAGQEADLVQAMVAMGRSMNMRVVGVGVETEAQLEALRAAGCDEAQGFHLGAPMPGDEFIATLLRNPAIDSAAEAPALASQARGG
jgi:EAL domain-containing protein (putative c-di-GMP-specific phosphodiesterase class I)/GGDEF domain-containing protein